MITIIMVTQIQIQYEADMILAAYVTVFWKTDHVVTNTEIHFLPIDKSHTHETPST